MAEVIGGKKHVQVKRLGTPVWTNIAKQFNKGMLAVRFTDKELEDIAYHYESEVVNRPIAEALIALVREHCGVEIGEDNWRVDGGNTIVIWERDAPEPMADG